MSVDVDERNAHWSARRRPVRSLEPMAGAPGDTRFPKFAAAMTAARAANAPQLTLHSDARAHDVPPPVGRDAPRPRAAQWRVARPPRRPVARWFGIGLGVLLVGSLLAAVPMASIGIEIERLMGPWLGWQDWLEWRHDRRPSAAFETDRDLSTTPEPAAGRDDPPPGSMPVSSDQGFEAAADPGPAAPADDVAVPAAEGPLARSVPVPALKPALTDR